MQDEWYRGFNSLLGHGFAISSEWSQPGKEGLISGLWTLNGVLNYYGMGIGSLSIATGSWITVPIISGLQALESSEIRYDCSILALKIIKLTRATRSDRNEALASSFRARLFFGLRPGLQ
jgi:hypothetical protein